MLTLETKEYKKAYQNSFNDFQNKMNLRNMIMPKVTKDVTNQASTSGTKVVEPKSSAKSKGNGELKDKPQNKISDKKETEDKES